MRASIEELARRIEDQPHLDNAEKLELLGLLSNIEKEVDHEAPGEDIEPIRESVKLAASTADEKSIPEQLEDKLLELEASHPQTANALGKIAHALSRMGI